MNIQDITTGNWQLGMNTQGEVVEDAADINQCILTIANTQIGTDPMRPLFGIDMLGNMDKPINVAVPNIVTSLTKAIERWEPRITITKVTYLITEGTWLQVTITGTAQNIKPFETKLSYELK